MFIRDLLQLVWQNLGRMKARVALTAIGVIIGTAAVVTLMSLGAGLQKSAVESITSVADLSQVVVFPPGFLEAFGPVPSRERRFRVLNKRAIEYIKSIPYVVAVTPQEGFHGEATIKLQRKVLPIVNIVGLDPVEARNLGWQLEEGAFRLSRNQVVVGAKVREMFVDPFRRRRAKEVDLYGKTLLIEIVRYESEKGPSTGQPGGVTPGRLGGSYPRRSVKKLRVKVVGVLKPRGESDYAIYMPLKEVHRLNEWAAGTRIDINKQGYNALLVKVESPDKVPKVEARLKKAGLPSYSMKQALDTLNRMFFVLQAIVGSIGGIALVVAAFGIANTMTMAIYERTREIGLMKALGATNRDVMSIFLAEAGTIGFIGGVVGMLLGAGVSQAISFAIINYVKQRGGEALPTYAHTPVWLMLLAVIFATGVGIASGVYPALRAASLPPVQALKYE